VQAAAWVRVLTVSPDSDDNTEKRAAEARADRWGFFGFFSLSLLVALAVILIVGPFPTGQGLYWVYFIYSLAGVCALHGIFFFFVNVERMNGKHLSARLPKFLEYAYSVLIMLGLLQIFVSSPRFLDYITFVGGEEKELLEDIRRNAKRHIEVECKKKDDKYYTEKFCAQMADIVGASDLRTYILDAKASDAYFLSHPIGFAPVAPWGSFTIYSPVATSANLLYAETQYKAEPPSGRKSSVFTWIGLLVLPIGIGLRILKTSLELFGDLK
jgi:hypothetical protein